MSLTLMFGFTRHHAHYTRATVGNRITQTLVGTLDELDISLADLSDEEGLVQVAVVALVVHSDVQVDNVSAPQFPRIGNAVANHLVHRPTLDRTD